LNHDICSIVFNASGFIGDRNCGDEAWGAVRTNGQCRGERW